MTLRRLRPLSECLNMLYTYWPEQRVISIFEEIIIPHNCEPWKNEHVAGLLMLLEDRISVGFLYSNGMNGNFDITANIFCALLTVRF
ncbi:hypothetical protein GJ496_001430 [Pomphorhynchus laevis]|nr:hypothetical protein GJ496_001430 [Pomphorhynchus laevis]